MNTVTEPRDARLSMAISLTDKYTNKQPIGKTSVSLKDESYKAVKNPSGYYLFLDIPIKAYVIQVRSDFYFDENPPVTLSPIDPKSSMKEKLKKIVQEIELEPNPAYPFPNGATLIRGIVTDQAENPVPNASVRIVEKGMATSTSEKGEYVFYFPPLTDSGIIKKDGKRYVKPKKNSKTTSLTVEAKTDSSLPGYATLGGVEEGTSVTALAIKLNISS